jgi:hypothetical protein
MIIQAHLIIFEKDGNKGTEGNRTRREKVHCTKAEVT